MTKPTSGSGIENTLKAAVILFETISNITDFTAKSLWKYAVKANNSFGVNCYMSYIARSKFQNIDRDNLIWLFTSVILNEHLLALVRLEIRKTPNFKLESILNSLQLAKSNPEFIKQIEDIIKLCVKGNILARRMPRVYNEVAIAKWKSDYDKFARQQ